MTERMEEWLIILNVVLFAVFLLALTGCLQLLKVLRLARVESELVKEDPEETESLLPQSYEKAILTSEPPWSSDDEEILGKNKSLSTEDIKTLQVTNEKDADCCTSDTDESQGSDDSRVSGYGEEPSSLAKSHGVLRNESETDLKHHGTRLVASFIYCKTTAEEYIAGKVTGLFDLPGRDDRMELYRVSMVLIPSLKYVLVTRHYSAWVSCRINEYFKFAFESSPQPGAALRIRVYGTKMQVGVPGNEQRIAEVYINMGHIMKSEKGIVYNRALC